jgi:hypothetical protein
MAVEAVPAVATGIVLKKRPLPFGLVTGAAGAHPMIHAQHFNYVSFSSPLTSDFKRPTLNV